MHTLNDHFRFSLASQEALVLLLPSTFVRMTCVPTVWLISSLPFIRFEWQAKRKLLLLFMISSFIRSFHYRSSSRPGRRVHNNPPLLFWIDWLVTIIDCAAFNCFPFVTFWPLISKQFSANKFVVAKIDCRLIELIVSIDIGNRLPMIRWLSCSHLHLFFLPPPLLSPQMNCFWLSLFVSAALNSRLPFISTSGFLLTTAWPNSSQSIWQLDSTAGFYFDPRTRLFRTMKRCLPFSLNQLNLILMISSSKNVQLWDPVLKLQSWVKHWLDRPKFKWVFRLAIRCALPGVCVGMSQFRHLVELVTMVTCKLRSANLV